MDPDSSDEARFRKRQKLSLQDTYHGCGTRIDAWDASCRRILTPKSLRNSIAPQASHFMISLPIRSRDEPVEEKPADACCDQTETLRHNPSQKDEQRAVLPNNGSDSHNVSVDIATETFRDFRERSPQFS